MDVTKSSFLGDSTSYVTKRFRRPKVNSSGLFCMALACPLCGRTATSFTEPPSRRILTIVQTVNIRVGKVLVAMA